MTGTDSKSAPVIPILIAMGAGALVGLLIHTHVGFADGALASGAITGDFVLVPVLELIGSMFINLLKMIIVPLILASVITGIANIGHGPDIGRLGGRALAFYVMTTLIAVLIALMILNIVEPGLDHGTPVGDKLTLTADAEKVAADVKARSDTSVFDTIGGIVPPNIIEAAANTKLLSILFFAVLFGFFLTRIESPFRETMTTFWQGVFQVMMKMTNWVMWLAPVGVFALIAKVIAISGFDSAWPLLLLALCVVAGLVIYGFVALPLLLAFVARVNPWRLYPAMAPALLTAFSTASSAATLPLSMQCLEQRVKVSKRIAGFVMPLGTSVNHAGSALYECAAALFIAQAYGLQLSFGTQFTVVILALITSMGVAGIPAASLVGIAIILAAVGLPAEAIGVLLVFDRILDMCRTAINVLADASCTVIVARLEGEQGVLAADSGR